MRKLDVELLTKKVDEHISSDIANAFVGGVTVIVNQDGKRVLKRTYEDEVFKNINDDTLYRLASMTKPIIAVAIMILRDRGLLSVEDNISKYLPAFAEMNIGKLDENDQPVFVSKAEKQIRIRDLLTHSSGLGSELVGMKAWDRRPESCKDLLEKSVDYYAETYLGFEPATKQMYSPAMAFDVLGRIVEIVSGKSLEDFLQKEIFIPLGMTHTTFNPTEEQWGKFVPMHNNHDGKQSFDPMEKGFVFEGVPHTCYCGAGGLASTAEDYSKFAEMLLGGKGILCDETIREMSSPQLSDIMKGEMVWGFGMRVIVQDVYKDLPVGSFGWGGAYGTHFWVDPENKITAIYMKNTRYNGEISSRTLRVFERDVTTSLIGE